MRKVIAGPGCSECVCGLINVPKENGEIGWTTKFCDCWYEFENLKKMYELLDASNVSMMNLVKNPISEISKDRLALIENALSDEERYEGKNWLFIWGPLGTGKTFLTVAAVQVAIAQEKSVFSIQVPEFLDNMRPDSKVIGTMEKAMSVDLLILDDWGKEKNAIWVGQQLFMLINKRYESGKPTIITSNIDPDEFNRDNITSVAIIERILHRSEIIVLSDKNFRTDKKY